ncbi:MAG: lysylphosphatidylglycerol synthase transmembrane domain-containing protein [Candidatus Moraniibacteriota bacterium]
MDKKKSIKLAVKVLISLFFVWWIIYKVDWSEVGGYLSGINLFWVSVYIFLYLLGMLVSAYKWKILALHKGIKLSLKEFYKAYFSATFVNNFMPSFVGGDSFKVYRIGKLSGNFKGAVSSVIMDRLTGLLGGMVLVVFFALLNFDFFLQNNILLLLSGLSLGGLIGLFVFLEFFRKRKIKTPLKKIDKGLNRVIEEINHYNGEEKIILKVVGWSFLFNLIGLAGANGVLFLALGIKIGVLDYLSVIFLASVVATVPISINNIGVKEWAYITFFGFFGLSAGAVVSVAITSRIIQMLLSFIAWPIYLQEKEKNN